MNRRNFLSFMLHAVLLPGALVLEGCSGEGEGAVQPQKSTPSPQTPTKEQSEGQCLFRGTWVHVEERHQPNHEMSVTAYAVDQGVQKTYILEDNGCGHTHTVVLTAEDFKKLQVNQNIAAISTEDAGHTHAITVDCV